MADPVNIVLVLLVLVGAVALFASEKFPMDFVAVLVLGTVLVLGLVRGIVTPAEGISGFSNPATITVGAMFVLSAGLQRTGALRVVGRGLAGAARYPLLLLVLMMVVAGAASAFMNNTPVVAVFLPMVLAACARRNIPPSKMLIPLSFASQFGGVCTLIGTSTNLLVSAISEQAGHGAFSMFELGRVGLILFGGGIVFFIVEGWWLLPSRGNEPLTQEYQLGEYITELRVMPGSPLIGRIDLESDLEHKHDCTVLEILREQRKLWALAGEPVKEGDVLLVRGRIADLMEIRDVQKLAIEPEFKLRDDALMTEDLTLVEALVAPKSRVVGRTLVDLDFRHRHRLIVLALQRRGQLLRDKLNAVRLEFGDALLLQGPKKAVRELRANEDFISLSETEEPTVRRRRAPLAVGIMVLVVVLAAFRLLPIMTTAILGCALMVGTRCLTLEDAYASVDWKVIFLLAGVFPLGIAMQNSGAATLIAKESLAAIGAFGPVAVLAAVFLLTAVLTEFMSNNAAAVLLAPIAIATAAALGLDPKPFLVAVTIAASTSFATPVGYQTNAMVYSPGGYRFTDFMKVGIPLNLLFWGLSVWLIPHFWPFAPGP